MLSTTPLLFIVYILKALATGSGSGGSSNAYAHVLPVADLSDVFVQYVANNTASVPDSYEQEAITLQRLLQRMYPIYNKEIVQIYQNAADISQQLKNINAEIISVQTTNTAKKVATVAEGESVMLIGEMIKIAENGKTIVASINTINKSSETIQKLRLLLVPGTFNVHVEEFFEDLTDRCAYIVGELARIFKGGNIPQFNVEACTKILQESHVSQRSVQALQMLMNFYSVRLRDYILSLHKYLVTSIYNLNSNTDLQKLFEEPADIDVTTFKQSVEALRKQVGNINNEMKAIETMVNHKTVNAAELRPAIAELFNQKVILVTAIQVFDYKNAKIRLQKIKDDEEKEELQKVVKAETSEIAAIYKKQIDAFYPLLEKAFEVLIKDKRNPGISVKEFLDLSKNIENKLVAALSREKVLMDIPENKKTKEPEAKKPEEPKKENKEEVKEVKKPVKKAAEKAAEVTPETKEEGFNWSYWGKVAGISLLVVALLGGIAYVAVTRKKSG